LFLTGQNEKAIKAFYKALELNYANKKVYNNLGMVFAKMKLYDKAFEVYEKGGTEATALNNLGVGYLENGEIDKAAKCFSKAIVVSPQFYTVANENLKKCRALQK
jgi:tetratricopeptide (TPR) repeat protein